MRRRREQREHAVGLAEEPLVGGVLLEEDGEQLGGEELVRVERARLQPREQPRQQPRLLRNVGGGGGLRL